MDWQGIEKEYGELDTVWFMSGSLFDTYPYDTPTEAFSLKLFRQVPCHRLSPPLKGQPGFVHPILDRNSLESAYFRCMKPPLQSLRIQHESQLLMRSVWCFIQLDYQVLCSHFPNPHTAYRI